MRWPFTFFNILIGYNGITLGDVADFGDENSQASTKLKLKTKLKINREARHIAKRVL